MSRIRIRKAKVVDIHAKGYQEGYLKGVEDTVARISWDREEYRGEVASYKLTITQLNTIIQEIRNP